MPERFAEAFDVSEARFRDIIENNADAILIVCHQGIVRYANLAAEAMFGKSVADLLGQPFGLPITQAETAEIDLPPRDGRQRIAEMRAVKTTWRAEPALLASLRDITDRKQAADALRFQADASQALARSLNFPETVDQVVKLAVAHLADWCVLDLVDGDRVWRTAQLRPKLQGAGKSDQLKDTWILDTAGTSALAAVVASGAPRLYCDFAPDELAQLIASPGRGDVVRALGGQSAMTLPLVARGRLIGAITCVSVVSPHRYGLAELALAADLAQRGAMALDNARLYEASQTGVRHRDQFLAMLAHELRNPLAAIFSAVELMHQSGGEQKILKRAEEVIERQGRHMARLLDDLLDISRVTHGKIELRRLVLDLRQTIRDSVEASGAQIRGRRHRVDLQLSAEPLWVDADPTRLEQVLTNLLNNAAKYMEPEGVITVAAGFEAGEIVIRVRDAGTGISAFDLPHIFDLFVQADRSLDRAQGGLGVGLTLVRHLIEMHGGGVSAHSQGKGRGSEFVLRLPVAATAPAAPLPAAPSQVTRRRHIVIVEDNADAREMLQMLLSVEGHDVDIAEDGRQGLALIERVRPEVALVDIGLPLMNGYELARALCNNSHRRPSLLVALTGYGQPEDRQRALEAGFDEHLIKPVDLDVLSDLLARA